MKYFHLFIAFSLLSFQITAQSSDEKDVATVVETLRLAMITPDQSILENLAAEDLSYGHSSGMIENKKEFVEEFVKKRSVFLTAEFTNQTIKVIGNTAIVRHRLTGDSYNKNVPDKIDIIVLLIWQKQNGQWKLIARQAAKIPV